MNVKIRKGDMVEVVTGREADKGKRGQVINVLLNDRRVVVQGVNIRTKHQKQIQTQAGRSMDPGRIQFEGPIHISNVKVLERAEKNGKDKGKGEKKAAKSADKPKAAKKTSAKKKASKEDAS